MLTLKSGDVFSLLPGAYKYKIEVSDGEVEPAEATNGTSKSVDGVNGESNGKKVDPEVVEEKKTEAKVPEKKSEAKPKGW